MKMYKDGIECNVQKEQVSAMENGGWDRKLPEPEEVEAPEVEEAEVEEEKTPLTPKAIPKKRKPIAKKPQ